MNELVDWIGKKRPRWALRLPSLAGSGLPERMRSTIFALLGLTAAAGLALVAIFAQPGFPLLEPAPLPAPPAGRQALADARPVSSNPAGRAAATATGVASSVPVAIEAPTGTREGAAPEAESGPVQQAPPPPPPSPAGTIGSGKPQGSPASPPSGHTPAPAPSPAPAPEPAPAPASPPPSAPAPIAAAPPPEPTSGPGQSPSAAAAEHASERGIERSSQSVVVCPEGPDDSSGESDASGWDDSSAESEASGWQERYLDSAHGRDEAAVPDRR